MTQRQARQLGMEDITPRTALTLALSNPDAFLDWLGKQSGALFTSGERITAGCPVARYLSAATGHKVIVGPVECWIDRTDTPSFPLPDWAITAVEYTDVLKDRLTHPILRSMMRATLYPEQYS